MCIEIPALVAKIDCPETRLGPLVQDVELCKDGEVLKTETEG